MEGKFVGFQILERDAERGQIFPYPASPEAVATQLRAMGYVVCGPNTKWKVEKTPYIKAAMEDLEDKNIVIGADVQPDEEKNWSPIPVVDEREPEDKKFKRAAVQAFAGLISPAKAGE